MSVTANSSDTGNGGSATVAKYQINSGLNAFVVGTGWGSGAWGAGTFGSASSISAAGQLRLWSQDNFGEDLIFNARGGGIFYWDESVGVGTRAVNATALSGASDVPTIALQVMVSDIDQHVIAFGSNPIAAQQLTRCLFGSLISRMQTGHLRQPTRQAVFVLTRVLRLLALFRQGKRY